ncbi:MAG: hypothetical protein ACPG6V_09795 [Flavobacteriales bacterium]
MKVTKTQIVKIHTTLNRNGFEPFEKKQIISSYTKSEDSTSTSDLTFDQANALLVKLGIEAEKENTVNYEHLNAGVINRENNQHRYIMSLLYQLKWVCQSKNQPRVILDRERFGRWLLTKTAEKKSLDKLSKTQTSKIISQLEIMLTKR